MQTPPDSTPSAPSQPFTVDLSGIWQSLVDKLDVIGGAVWKGISDNLPMIGTTIWGALSNALYGGVKGLFVAMWNATFLTIPRNLTDQFAPVAALTPPPGAIAGGGLVLVLALLGIRAQVRGMIGHGGILDELLVRIAKYLAILSVLPWIISKSIEVEQVLARSVAITTMIDVLPNSVGSTDPISFTLSLILMLFFGIRLWLKLASNIVHVAVACVWSPVAMFCGLLPETVWVAGLWTREFGGRLAGAVLAAIASSIGLAIALLSPGMLSFVGVAGAFMAAHDFVDWLARTPGTGMGGLVGMGMRMGVGMVGGGAGSAIATGAAATEGNRLAALPTAAAFYSFD